TRRRAATARASTYACSMQTPDLGSAPVPAPHDGSPQDLHERLSDLFATLGRAIAELERGGGPSRIEFSVLVHLARTDGLRLTDLAEAEGLDPSTMSRRLATLGDQGLVRREPDPDDRRASRLHLTPEGRECLQ